MKISVVIPAHNEEDNIKETVNKVENSLKNMKHEIIVLNDNSTDRTGNIVNEITNKIKTVKVVHREPPRGFGLTLRDGFKAATGDVIVPLMADLSDDPEDINKMIKKIEEGYDIVLGSRFLKESKIENYPKIKLILGNRLFNIVFRFLYFSKFKDATNAFKAYRREVLDSMKISSNGFSITIETVIKAMIKGYKITDVPVSWSNRTGGLPKMNFLKEGVYYGELLFKLWPSYLKSKILKKNQHYLQ